MRLGGLALALLCMSNVAACREHSSAYSRPGDDPHDTDSLYALYRRILTDSNPVPTWAQVYCAYARLADRVGDDEAKRRFDALRDTVYSRAENGRWTAVERKLALHGYALNDATCGPGFEFHYVPDTTAPGIRPMPKPER